MHAALCHSVTRLRFLQGCNNSFTEAKVKVCFARLADISVLLRWWSSAILGTRGLGCPCFRHCSLVPFSRRHPPAAHLAQSRRSPQLPPLACTHASLGVFFTSRALPRPRLWLMPVPSCTALPQ